MGLTDHLQWQEWCMLQKYKILKNGPKFDRLERPPKINIFEKYLNILFFWVLEHLYALGAKFRKTEFFWTTLLYIQQVKISATFFTSWIDYFWE